MSSLPASIHAQNAVMSFGAFNQLQFPLALPITTPARPYPTNLHDNSSNGIRN